MITVIGDETCEVQRSNTLTSAFGDKNKLIFVITIVVAGKTKFIPEKEIPVGMLHDIYIYIYIYIYTYIN